MKEWILENTTVTEEEYNALINPYTVYIEEEIVSINLPKNTPYDHPFLMISQYTEKKPSLWRNLIYCIKKKNKLYFYQNIPFHIASEFLQEDFYHQKELGNCFEISIKLCQKYENTKVLTLLILDPDYKEPLPMLHTVLSITKDNHEYIVDASFNIIMERNKYIELLHGQIISEIERDTLINDYKDILNSKIKDYVYDIEYLCFKDKTMESIRKLTKKP